MYDLALKKVSNERRTKRKKSYIDNKNHQTFDHIRLLSSIAAK